MPDSYVGTGKQTAAILEFYFRFERDQIYVIGRRVGLHQSTKFRHNRTTHGTDIWRSVDFQDGGDKLANLLASCLIYARAFIEYVCGCILFQDVSLPSVKFAEDKVLTFLILRKKC